MKRMMSFALAFLLIISSGFCFNFGSYAKQSIAAFVNGNANFDIMIWTADSIPLNISFSVSESPDGIDVTISPDSLVIDNSIGTELVSSGNGYANASIVKVSAKQSNGCGNGTVKVIAKASSQSGGVGANQERIFRLSAIGNTCNEPVSTTISATTTTYMTTDTFSPGKPNSQGNPFYFFIFALSIIILLLCAAKVLKEGF